jgi:NAD+ synthase
MKQLANQITEWIKNYANNAGIQSLVVGISGGIDSVLWSAHCAPEQD